jgi:hypothetical protein
MKERFNYRADTAWTGRYLTRRPDRSLIYLEDAQRAADKQKL